jgi:hypothetical protein
LELWNLKPWNAAGILNSEALELWNAAGIWNGEAFERRRHLNGTKCL